MKLKQIIKRITPPLFIDIYRNGFRGLYIWQGVYANHRDVPVTGKSYFAENVANETFQYTKGLLTEHKKNKHIPYHINEENTFLPLLASLILKRGEKLSVLDLGGGMGIGFLSMLDCVEDLTPLEYYVIETPVMCKAGSELFKDDKSIRFLPALPDSLPGLDIVYINSALQYFDNYLDTLHKLSSYRPKYFLFVKFSAGDVPTYATMQRNLPGTTSAYWFFNVQEVISLMSSLGYTLKFKSSLSREYNQDNFPVGYRLKQTCNLLFERSERMNDSDK